MAEYTTKKELNRVPYSRSWATCSRFHDGECVFEEYEKIGQPDNVYKVKTCPWKRTMKCETLRIVSYWNAIQDGMV